MNTSALIMMISVMSVVTAITIYFFVRVYKSPKRPEPDSFSGNDPV
jgi:heme/copper-type cytochrome/quinol oxidase subunit 2